MYTRFAPPTLPEGVPAAVMEAIPHACFALTEDLDISYCNSAWDRFVAENGGAACVTSSEVLHKPYLRWVPHELVPAIKALFRTARASGRPQAQDYECSSAQTFRLYRMQVYPLKPGSGFAVVNALRVVHPHTRVACDADKAKYLHNDGLIRMCANCRRVRRLDDPSRWDWVPDYIEHPPAGVSHSVCPFCGEYYYSVFLRRALK